MRRLRWRCAALLIPLLLGADECAKPPPLPAPDVDYAGCAGVLSPGPVCVLEEKRQLFLWVGAPPETNIEIQVDGTRVDVGGEQVQEGRRFSLSLADAARSVEVLAADRAAWSLAVAEPGSKPPSGSRDVLAEAKGKAGAIAGFIQTGDLAATRSTLAGIPLPPKPVAQARYFPAFFRGRLAELEGDYRTALGEMHSAIEIAERVRLDRFRLLAEEELALILRGVGRSRESAEIFERLRREQGVISACERAQLLNNQAWTALLAREAGESSADPLPVLEEALATSDRCRPPKPERKAIILVNLAMAHLQDGQLAETGPLLSRARELDPHPPLFQRLFWLDIEARIALGENRPVAALAAFAELGDLAAQTSSFDGRLRSLFGQARSLQALGRPAAALATLVAAEELLDEQSLQIPIHEGRESFIATRQSIVSLHIELLLDQGRNVEALEAARRARSRILRQLAQGDRLAELLPEQRDRRSRLLTAYQQRRAALELRAQDEWKLPVDQRLHEEAARRAEAEAAKKLLDDAFLVLGELRTPGVERLPPPRAGELVLVYHTLPTGWVGFAADGETVAVHRFELPPDALSRPAELAQRLLLPFHAGIERAKRIRILPSGRLEQVDFHALPFAGTVLMASRPVVYGLDLDVASRPAESVRRQAFLVTDPRENLRGAVVEARAVRGLLASAPRPWVIKELRGRDASRKAVLGELGAADLFHYAGHGSFSGFGGWESSLLLADDSQLTLGDLLALKALPTWVVLSGCDTGRSAAEAPVATLGLAHAFLLAGAGAVVASTRPADDRAVPAFFTELYRQWDREPDLAVALQRAQLAWRDENPKADWASFRLFEP